MTVPYVIDYPPPDHLRDFEEERRITRACVLIIAELDDGLLMRGDTFLIPEDTPDDLRARMVALEPYLRWASGKEANAWLPGGPANFPEAA
jgi:hypothetical protein